MGDPPQQAIELILARNLISSIGLAALLFDADGALVFFNEAAGDLIGRRFEEVGRLAPDEWTSQVGPFDEFGSLLAADEIPMTTALREGLPTNASFRLRFSGDELTPIEVSGLPLVAADGFKGAIIAFWRAPEHDGEG